MDEVLEHINPTDTSNLVNLYKGTNLYGEVRRLLYLAIRKAVELEVDTFHITLERVSNR